MRLCGYLHISSIGFVNLVIVLCTGKHAESLGEQYALPRHVQFYGCTAGDDARVLHALQRL
jgi:hypothetical protein